MKKSCKVEWSGVKIDPLKIPIGVQALLADIGMATAAEMRSHTKDHDVSKRLSNSITWQTSDRGSNAYGEHRNEDKLDKPKEDGVLYVGSAAPHALFREIGSGPHKNPEGSQQFLDSLNEWTIAVLGVDRDSPDPAIRYHYWNIVKDIRAHGTEAKPFLEPTIPEIPKIAAQAWFRAIKLFYSKAGNK